MTYSAMTKFVKCNLICVLYFDTQEDTYNYHVTLISFCIIRFMSKYYLCTIGKQLFNFFVFNHLMLKQKDRPVYSLMFFLHLYFLSGSKVVNTGQKHSTGCARDSHLA